ncbi:hypothetical protein [Streptomyces sp. IBSBF 2435]|uniref:hypothetical protein n=1 Tax=Streptomyces sp. IBSBF 2435 TaxID=2903531 RepID=UPI002FDC2E10
MEEEEAARCEEDEDGAGSAGYQHDLSIPPGWRVGGSASWHVTGPAPMDCVACSAPEEVLLTIDSSEWDGGSGSWKPTEDRKPHPYPFSFATPTRIRVGRDGELNGSACPADPAHPHRWSLQWTVGRPEAVVDAAVAVRVRGSQ